MNLDIKILIAEDDLLIAENLKDILLDFGFVHCEIACKKEQIYEKLRKFQPNLVLLDIQMSEFDSGIKIAIDLNREFNIPFIYITAQADKKIMDMALDTNPLGYIIKPFNEKEIYASLFLFSTSFSKNEIFLKGINGEVKIKLNEIMYVKSDKNYVEVYSKEKRVVIRTSLKLFLEEMNLPFLVQVHKSYVVNVNQIQSIKGSNLNCAGFQIPYSKVFLPSLKNIFHKQ